MIMNIAFMLVCGFSIHVNLSVTISLVKARIFHFKTLPQAVLLLSLGAAALATPQFPDYGFYDYGGFPDYFDYGRARKHQFFTESYLGTTITVTRTITNIVITTWMINV